MPARDSLLGMQSSENKYSVDPGSVGETSYRGVRRACRDRRPREECIAEPCIAMGPKVGATVWKAHCMGCCTAQGEHLIDRQPIRNARDYVHGGYEVEVCRM